MFRYVTVKPASSHSPDGSFRNQVSTPAAWIMCRAFVSNETLAAGYAGEGYIYIYIYIGTLTYTMQYSAILYYTMPYYAILYYAVDYYYILWYIA